MNDIAERLAAEAVDKIIEDADSGDTYSPCFRDCLYDNRKMAERRITEAIQAAMGLLAAGQALPPNGSSK